MSESNDSSLYSECDQLPYKLTKGLNSGNWLSILSLLRTGSHSEQVMALTELSNLLSYSNEDYLLGFPSLSFIKVLFHILENPNAKYSKSLAKNTEKSAESQEPNIKVQFPYYSLLSSVYKDENILTDSDYDDNFYDASEKQPVDEPKDEESAMDVDEESFHPDNQIFINKMILSATCLNTILDIIPYTSRYFAMNGNLSTLCSKLSDMEYIDLAERILLIFEKLSNEIPLSLLRKSVLFHILQYIDFFPTDVQVSTLNSVLNVVRLVDNKESFSMFVLPILTQLSSFFNNSNKKLVEIVLNIWKDLLSIVTKVGDEKLISDFVSKLTENNFLEKVLQLILSPNVGRSAILEYVSILSSLVRMSSEMVRQLFKYDQLVNIKSLCYNQKDSLQYVFIHLSNSILSNPQESCELDYYQEYQDCEMSPLLDSVSIESELEKVNMYINSLENKDRVASETKDLNEQDPVKQPELSRDKFFCENPEFFGVLFELLPISELCGLCYLMTSDRHKCALISLINNLLRIGNKIENFRQALVTTLSVSKTTEFVATCLLQVDLNLENTFENLLGILETLMSIFGNEVISTFERHGISSYLRSIQMLSDSDGNEKSFKDTKKTSNIMQKEFVKQILSLSSFEVEDVDEGSPYHSQQESDLLFEIRNNVDVWTPYELVKNVSLQKLNFLRNEESLERFITTLVTKSFTSAHLQELWKAFLKILQYNNFNSDGRNCENSSMDNYDNSTSTPSRKASSADPNYNFEGSSKDSPRYVSRDVSRGVYRDITGISPRYSSRNTPKKNNEESQSHKSSESTPRNQEGSQSPYKYDRHLRSRGRPHLVWTDKTYRYQNYMFFSKGEGSSKSATKSFLTKYIRSYSPHPFNITEIELKLRLRPYYVNLLDNYQNLTSDRLSNIQNQSQSSQKHQNYKDTLKQEKDDQVTRESPTTKASESDSTKETTSGKLLPICVYVPCLVRISKVESYIRRYIEKKIGVKVSEVYVYVNGVCLGSNVILYEALCRFGGFSYKKRKQITSQPHLIKYTYTLVTQNECDKTFESKNENVNNWDTQTVDEGSAINTVDTTTIPESSQSNNEYGLENTQEFTSSSQNNQETDNFKRKWESMTIKSYTLYKGGKFNFKNLVSDFNQFMCLNYTNKDFDKTEDFKFNKEFDMDRDDSTTYNTSRLQDDLIGECDTQGFGDESLNYYTQDLPDYNTECDIKMTERYNNPIIYTNIPSFDTFDKDKPENLDHLIKLVKYDQERLNFIFGEKNEFNDLLVETSFPLCDQNSGVKMCLTPSDRGTVSDKEGKLPNDKKVLLRVLSIFSNLISNLGHNYLEKSGNNSIDNSFDYVQCTPDYTMESSFSKINDDSLNEDQCDPNGLVTSTPLSLKVLSSLSDLGVSLCYGCDYWVHFVLACPSVFSLTSRTLLFKINTLGLNRNLSELYSRLKNVSNDLINDPFDEYLFEYIVNNNIRLLEEVKVPKHKLVLDRDNLLNDAINGFEKLQNNPKLEVEYVNEVGIGSGPTLEFFTLVSEKLTSYENPKLFEYLGGYYYPLPHQFKLDNVETFMCDVVNCDDTHNFCDLNNLDHKVFKLFSFLGKVFAYALLDDKLFDLFIHPHFWSLVKHPNKPQNLTLDTLRMVDPELANSLEQVKNHPNPSELHLTYEYQGCELFEGGSNVYVTLDNVNDYVNKVIEFKLFSGIKLQVWSFRYGFSCVLPLYSLWFFHDLELSEFVFGNIKSQDKFWTLEHLRSYIVADHGYDATSKVYNDLISILHSFNDNERRLFLKFTTGSPILPRNGFKSLVPLMKIVKKGNVNELPSVMTCTNYLKMPQYESLEEMKLKLLRAIHDGQNSFNLS